MFVEREGLTSSVDRGALLSQTYRLVDLALVRPCSFGVRPSVVAAAAYMVVRLGMVAPVERQCKSLIKF